MFKSTVTRWFLKVCLVCKNLNDQARSGRPKSVESEAVLQSWKQIQHVALGEYQVNLASHCLVWFVTFTESYLMLAKYCKFLTPSCIYPLAPAKNLWYKVKFNVETFQCMSGWCQKYLSFFNILLFHGVFMHVSLSQLLIFIITHFAGFVWEGSLTVKEFFS